MVREQKDLARLMELLWDKNSSAAIQSLHKKSFLRLSLPELLYIYKHTFSYDCNANFAYKRFNLGYGAKKGGKVWSFTIRERRGGSLRIKNTG